MENKYLIEQTSTINKLDDININKSNLKEKILILDNTYKALLNKIEIKKNNIIELDFLFNEFSLLDFNTNKLFIFKHLNELRNIEEGIEEKENIYQINFLYNERLYYLILYYYLYNNKHINELFSFIFNYNITTINSKYRLILYISYLNLNNIEYKHLYNIISNDINLENLQRYYKNEYELIKFNIDKIKKSFEESNYNLYDYMKNNILYYMIYLHDNESESNSNDNNESNENNNIKNKIKEININEYINVCNNIFIKYSYVYIINWFNILVNNKKINFVNLPLYIDTNHELNPKNKQLITVKFFITILLYSFNTKTEDLNILYDLIDTSKSIKSFNKSIYYRFKDKFINNYKINSFKSFYNYLKGDMLDEYLKNYFELLYSYILN